MSLEKVSALLKKQKIVEDMIRNQQMPRQDLVETVVHRQHLAELEQLMISLSAVEIGYILEALPIEDARLLWEQIPQERQNDVLWEVSNLVRTHLAGNREPSFSQSQMSAFELADGCLQQIAINCRKDLEGICPIWIDLLNATKPARAYIGEHFRLHLPDPGDTTDLEVSSRFHIAEDGEIHLHSNFLLDREGDSRSVPVVFIVHEGILFSVRDEELPVFRLQRRRAKTQPGYVSDCKDLLLDLYGAEVEYSADCLEDVYCALGKVSHQVLSEKITDEELAGILTDIAEEEDLNGRIRSNILDTQRALAFLVRNKVLSKDQFGDAKQILHNIDSLNSHTAFIFDKINFLMDAIIGFININQNRRINKLTAFGLVFMPLNIIAGIGGMSEFSMMTEGIPWPIAYGSLILAMCMLGWMTYILLKHFEARRAKKFLHMRHGG